MIFALVAPAIILLVGFGIDLSRYQALRSVTQDAVDAAVLAGAASGIQELDALETLVTQYLEPNLNQGGQRINAGYTVAVTQEPGQRLQAVLTGEVDTLFGSVFNIPRLPLVVDAVAERGAADGVELVMVLDNTWSMSASAGSTTRINALKSSARILTNALMTTDVDNVKFGVVPYAEYVNVGTSNRSASWISVPPDYSSTSTPSPRVCTQVPVTTTTCTGGVRGTCTRFKDGVPESYACWTTPQTCRTTPVTPAQTRESCTGGGSPVTTRYSWYGCVYSRNTGTLRLNDTRPETVYKGFLGTSQTCLNPIQTLTDQKATVLTTIDNLVVNVGSYRPETHIPSGLIWGVNVLSPTQPFIEGAAYSPGNRAPRKILVLMTDGENTLRFNPGDGRHLTLSTNAATAATQKRATNDDVASICAYAKSKEIEIFTVGLAVDTEAAQTLLSDCASDSDHYFDATDATSLEAAFTGIAASINAVRLVE
ncbi:pilus assembly protein TadG-related protein [Brevundimonas sp. LM2]|uniref:pilus assembly protein TadG-related protein n=1 Tax=Brevundimonas sp. LM2 TaxID=1938605 RepID=UPI0015C55F64|nr:pilus assembly protein TadG-related protein [Brevundimonas sp. LM2]